MQFFSPVFLTTFFFVSGYLFKSGNKFSVVFEQRTRTLLWPLLSLGTLMIVMQHVLTFKDAPVPLAEAFKGLLLQNGHNQLLWFVAALYVYSLLFYWIERMSGRWLLPVSILLFLANWLCMYILELPSMPWYLNSAGFGCAYMGLGKVYRQQEQAINSHVQSWHLWVATGIYVLVILVIGHSCSFAGSKHLWDSIVLTTVGLFVIIEASKRQPWVESRLLLFVGANTLFYFAFHGKGYALIQALVDKLFVATHLHHSVLADTLAGLSITLIDALLLIIPALLVNRHGAWLLGRGFRLYS